MNKFRKRHYRQLDKTSFLMLRTDFFIDYDWSGKIFVYLQLIRREEKYKF